MPLSRPPTPADPLPLLLLLLPPVLLLLLPPPPSPTLLRSLLNPEAFSSCRCACSLACAEARRRAGRAGSPAWERGVARKRGVCAGADLH